MANINANWARIWQVIEMSGMTINAFAHHIGLLRSETLYQIKNGKNGISRNVADCIVDKFPQISKPWLLTGYGSMYAGDDDNCAMQIPFYNCDLRTVPEVVGVRKPDSYMFVPQIRSADFAIRYCSDDMEPSIADGTILFLKKIEPESMILGNEYVIIGQKLVTLRKVRSTSDDAVLMLEVANKENYDNMIIRLSDIREVYAVKGKLIIKN